MRKRIFASICATALASVLLVFGLVTWVLYTALDKAAWERLHEETHYIAAGYEAQGDSYLAVVKDLKSRLTLVAPSGTVLFDSVASPESMENHAARPEVQAALETGQGTAQRLSGTLSERTLYYALRLSGGDVLRVSATVSSVWAMVKGVLPLFVLICAAVVVLAAVLARVLTRAIIAPLNSLDLEAPLANKTYAELSPLLRRIARQNEKIDRQRKKYEDSQREFETITGHLSEGLVVLNTKGQVLSINPSAGAILGANGRGVTGKFILELSRNLALEQAVNASVAGKKQDTVLAFGGRSYHLLASPVYKGQMLTGALLLLLDETEKLAAEQMRREFSANVSHELKTPLTSISGYAEIMQNGLAKKEDTQHFAKRIYDEANRMIALVEDIIKLSRLDEKQGDFVKNPVHLLPLARQVAATLAPLAQKHGVTLCAEGEEAEIEGVYAVLEEVVQNLAENAVKYNRPGGSVHIRVENEAQGPTLTVQDTGIGIPVGQQARVFERFYRVDKSHAKQTGGTGLGLSIVKHGVAWHGGSIQLTSTEGEGTTVKVIFPPGS